MESKYILIFFTIFILVFGIGYAATLYVDSQLELEGVNHVNAEVENKYSEIIKGQKQYRVLSSSENFYIVQDKNLFDKIQIGKRYNFITKGNRNIEDQKYPVIIEVRNVRT